MTKDQQQALRFVKTGIFDKLIPIDDEPNEKSPISCETLPLNECPFVPSINERLQNILTDVKHNIVFNLEPENKIISCKLDTKMLLNYDIPSYKTEIKEIYDLKNGDILGFEEKFDKTNDLGFKVQSKFASALDIIKENFPHLKELNDNFKIPVYEDNNRPVVDQEVQQSIVIENEDQLIGKTNDLMQIAVDSHSKLLLNTKIGAAVTNPPPQLESFSGQRVYDMNKKAYKWARSVDLVNDDDEIADFETKLPNIGHSWPFELDAFQKHAILKISRGETVLVAAHTSAGKTVVAEYAIALAKRNKTRVVYTSPIKALSNQKFRDFKKVFGDDIGLITGDVYIKSNAFCLIMTTEILKVMLYTNDDLINELEWVIFDEVHYINDEERGVVWEEVFILLPPHVKMIFLSATAPNAMEFADWIGSIKNRPIYVIYTSKRPVPLEHFLYVSNLVDPRKPKDPRTFLIIDSANNFLGHNYALANEKLQLALGGSDYKPVSKRKPPGVGDSHQNQTHLLSANNSTPTSPDTNSEHNKQLSFQQQSHRQSTATPASHKNSFPNSINSSNKSAPSPSITNFSRNKAAAVAAAASRGKNKVLPIIRDKKVWINLIDHLKQFNKLPAVVFVFSRKRIDGIVNSLRDLNLTDKSERSHIEVFTRKCIAKLNPVDKDLPQVQYIIRLLLNGIGIHHSGILPLLKEMVEFLFHLTFVKVLFATETFAMGLNMPAKTVIFESLRKFDGTNFRSLAPAEYIQMAGRAGRRGMDTTGSIYIMCKDVMIDEIDLKMIMLGTPAKLESKFYLNYGMILHLLQNKSMRAEDMMKRSFAEFYNQANAGTQLSELKVLLTQTQKPEDFECEFCLTDIQYLYETYKEYLANQNYLMNKLMTYKNLESIFKSGRILLFKHFLPRANPKPTAKLSPEEKTSDSAISPPYSIVLGIVLNIVTAASDRNRRGPAENSISLSDPTNLQVLYVSPRDFNLNKKSSFSDGKDIKSDGSSSSPVEFTNETDMLEILLNPAGFIQNNFLNTDTASTNHKSTNHLNGGGGGKGKNGKTFNNLVKIGMKESGDRFGITTIRVRDIIYLTNLSTGINAKKLLRDYQFERRNLEKNVKGGTGFKNSQKNREETHDSSRFNFFRFVPVLLEKLRNQLLMRNSKSSSFFIGEKIYEQNSGYPPPNLANLSISKTNDSSSIHSTVQILKRAPDVNNNNKNVPAAAAIHRFDFESDLELEDILKRMAAQLSLLKEFKCLVYCPHLIPSHFADYCAFTDYNRKMAKLKQLSVSLGLDSETGADALNDQQYANMQFLPEYEQRIKVLKKLEYIDENLVSLMKGRVACCITSGEVILTELLFWNYFEGLPPEVIVGVLSCLVCQEKHIETPILTPELLIHQENFLKIVKKVMIVEGECRINTDNFMDGFNFSMMEVVYQWAIGRSFKEIMTYTNAQEGAIVRCIQRLEEICHNVRNAARIIGETNLYKKMEEASFKIKRDIVFAASLYTTD